jgi:hypothetical protein
MTSEQPTIVKLIDMKASKAAAHEMFETARRIDERLNSRRRYKHDADDVELYSKLMVNRWLDKAAKTDGVRPLDGALALCREAARKHRISYQKET